MNQTEIGKKNCTADNVFTLSILSEILSKKCKKLFDSFINFQKAFDFCLAAKVMG